jgi:hypothetical protein
MIVLPHHETFKLSSSIDNVPAGATGQLKRLDRYHVALLFDNHHYEDLVFDTYDTDPSVWSAIQPLYTASPSMTDPPSSRWHIAAAVLVGLLVGWLTFPQPAVTAGLLLNIIGFNSD